MPTSTVTHRARAWLRRRDPGARFTIQDCVVALGISNDTGKRDVAEAFAWCEGEYVERVGSEFVRKATVKEGSL